MSLFNKIFNNNDREIAMSNVARSLGLQFAAKPEKDILHYLKDFKLFRSRGSISNLMYRDDDWNAQDVNIFDYQYTVSTGKSSITFKQTVFFANAKSLGLPQFIMQPENFFHKIGTYFGMQDIDFVEYPKFSHHYLLQGEDEELIRYMMNDQILRFFTIHPNWILQGQNYFLVMYQHNKLFHSEAIKDFYIKGMQCCEMLRADTV